MLYMKTRVTFRVAPELADALRVLPNQTQFVERALAAALQVECPMCEGTGRVRRAEVRVSNLKARGISPIGRTLALELKSLVHLARDAGATSVSLDGRADGGVAFVVTRGATSLLRGALGGHGTSIGN
jgi:hypothetical protein